MIFFADIGFTDIVKCNLDEWKKINQTNISQFVPPNIVIIFDLLYFRPKKKNWDNILFQFWLEIVISGDRNHLEGHTLRPRLDG